MRPERGLAKRRTRGVTYVRYGLLLAAMYGCSILNERFALTGVTAAAVYFLGIIGAAGAGMVWHRLLRRKVDDPMDPKTPSSSDPV